MCLLLLKTTLLAYLLLILVGCPGKQQRVQAKYGSENLTMTCAHKALEEMDDITKVWIFYDQTYGLTSYDKRHGAGIDGVAFEGDEFEGHVEFERAESSGRVFVDIFVYTKELYWGFRNKPNFIKKVEEIKDLIKEALSTRCGDL